MRASSAANLLRSVGLLPTGPLIWGTNVPLAAPGVYLVETPEPLAGAPLDHQVLSAWIERVSSLRVDGDRPTPAVLAERLASFWIPDETVVYIGRAGTSVATRLRAYYSTSLGNRGPHAGGHWIKTLAGLATFRVWWAESDEPALAEDTLLDAFARRHGGGLVLPFANRQTAHGARKAHGITGSTLRVDGEERRSPVTRPRRPGASAHRMGRIVDINAAIQRLACADASGEIRAVDAAAELDRQGLLNDSAERRGLPLRRLLREGRIDYAYQRDGTRWFIRCAGR